MPLSQDICQDILKSLNSVILDKEKKLTLALSCLLSGGHLLLEDLPGMGKTTLARAMAAVLGLSSQRIQFTSDMLPGDLLGASIFNEKTREFEFHPGPVFTHMLLADEINRGSPRTQSALLEVMAEHQVSYEGKTRNIPDPFFVIATQNPLDQAGTFPLPESQLDRFAMRLSLGFPAKAQEIRILKNENQSPDLPALTDATGLLELQKAASQVFVSALRAAPIRRSRTPSPRGHPGRFWRPLGPGPLSPAVTMQLRMTCRRSSPRPPSTASAKAISPPWTRPPTATGS